MKKKIFLGFFLLLISCQSKIEKNKTVILTSITPYQIFIEEIVGDFAEVKSIVPGNQNPISSPLP